MLLSSNKEISLLAPCDGRAIPLSEVADEAFSSGMLGIGFGVLPTGGHILSPIAGRVASVAEAKHAYTLVGEKGAEVLVHIGVDTVSLGGAPFSPLVGEGERVRAGAPLAEVDFSAIRARSLSDTVIVLLCDAEGVEAVRYEYGACTGGESAPMRFRLRR